ncbi:tRNA threonylcarbamoyladenosine biosynthesis protein TsaE [Arenibacter nanhaiticus]|uniref:tRNA threonylcarbamoyladenosine biosynthesis protein TsaE n=1 Tax=Arenibacter nanhaiticus TaxID=558155 RepID=A0A1M6FXX3_9FLAO|nr:tRNA (adenosine(37)-N6)-threonylcarbamoyltransferase complex ATPase subunit type 1 TsaE [Arenibacter nanhaiticus]SHJ02517.1 tRNA threonylcarbamoyladenosine biosynthesis protein TsaE [Arenibacter nanhaiticus]
MTITYSQEQLSAVAQQIIDKTPNKTLCFYGQMGAGKTTLIKAIVTALGGSGTTNSPTFGIVNEYHNSNEELLAYHFDFYRLNDETEALDMGLEDYLYANTWVFIEWPEKINSLLPDDCCNINISILDEKTRSLSMS